MAVPRQTRSVAAAVKRAGAIEPVDFDKDRSSLFGSALTHCREDAFDIAAAQIAETHMPDFNRIDFSSTSDRRAAIHSSGRPVIAASSHDAVGYLACDGQLVIAFELLDRSARIRSNTPLA